ncbi:MAG TPA: toxin-antitoxin system HicB family antitoxin [Acidobacteriaceae bacterium]|jgi:hypothetical protein|nr:toxin-antitoxin system HicB family antitoxin [Acidobacteriaceae bacterium]
MARSGDGLEDIILRLPASLRSRAEEMAASEELSLNLFVATAIAERLQRLQLSHCLGISDQDELRHRRVGEGLPLIH